jgi:hypothetical protein
MSYNGSGTFQINTSGQPVVAGTVISSTAFNALTADLATGLSTAITKDGQTTTTARIPFAQGISSTLTTDSSSVSTGSIITAGGVGIAKNLYVGVNANIAGTLGVTGVATFSAAPIYSSLTASSAVATDASKGLVSVTNTGTGNNVLATSPTLVTPILGAASATSITVDAGAVGTPSITTTGDTNTGIFFPAADTIAFTEGGVESARIDSSGNFGIGTTAPNAKLNVAAGDAASATNQVNISGGRSLGGGVYGSAGSILFTNSYWTSGYGAASISGMDSGSSGGFLGFATTTNGTGTTGTPTERMRISSTGDVGIGTTSPAYKLDVSGPATATPVTNGIIRILTTGSNPPTGNGGGLVFSQVDSGGTNRDYSSITGSRVDSTSDNRVDMVFSTGNPGASVPIAERMRITTGGKVGINTGGAAYGGTVFQLGVNNTNYCIAVNATAGGTTDMIGFYSSGTFAGKVSSSGATTSYTSASDYRLKDNIIPMTGALAKVSALKPCTYKWKSDGSDGEGFIAHELAEVCPYAVNGEKDEVDSEGNIRAQSIDTSFLVATLTAAIQEQQALITSLTARIIALETQ